MRICVRGMHVRAYAALAYLENTMQFADCHLPGVFDLACAREKHKLRKGHRIQSQFPTLIVLTEVNRIIGMSMYIYTYMHGLKIKYARHRCMRL